MINIIKKYLTPFQMFEILGVVLFSIYFAITNKENTPLYITIDTIASICGITCVVLCAGGKRAQYYWGTINILSYLFIAYSNQLYGEVMLNGLYYLPCQFFGLYYWKKHLTDKTGTVKSEKMKPSILILTLLGSIIFIYIYKLLLNYLGGNSAWLDSTTTILSIVANFLMILRYREQWIFWIIVNCFSVLMWILRNDYIMTAMWSFYLINSVYGLIIWTKNNKVLK
ncbi:MAG: nicotinamide riboside transporter PnuC [Bacteroidales bacterium]|nr:nicotinamide riboside transporter PnuC [Bacteroidales bacterium]